MINIKGFGLVIIVCYLLLSLVMSNISYAQLSPFLVKDINPGASESNPVSFVELNGDLFFAAKNPSEPYDLYKSDGTGPGTVLFKDFSSNEKLEQLLVSNNQLFFYVNKSSPIGSELWKSDGTISGTSKIVDFDASSVEAFLPQLENFTTIGSQLFFMGITSSLGYELYKTDGTNVELIKDIRPGSDSSYPSKFAVLDGTLVFSADNGVVGNELWKSDGTINGTTIVKDINPSGGSLSFLSNKVVSNGFAYFRADNGTNGNELWKTDGTGTGTSLVIDLNSGSNSSDPTPLISLNSNLLFTADNGTHGRELWKTDGTAVGTVMIKDIYPGASGSDIREATLLTDSNVVIFIADNDTNGREVWRTDGTSNGTYMLRDIVPGPSNSFPSGFNTSFITRTSEHVFFNASGESEGKFWQTDGTIQGTHPVFFYNDVTQPSYIYDAKIVGNLMYLSTGYEYQGVLKNELYAADITDITPVITLSSPNGGETYQPNSVQPIIYSATYIDSVTIEYSLNNGVSWNLISAATPTVGFHNWNIPNVSSTQSLVRVLNASETINPASDMSNGVFSIQPLQPLKVLDVTPNQNANDIELNTNISALFSNSMVSGTTQSFTVHGSMSGIRSGVYSGGGTNSLTIDPTLNFFPGEKVEVSFSTSAISTSNVNLVTPFITQFTAAAGIGPATFSYRSSTFGPGNDATRWGLKLGDMDNDGDLDIVLGRSETTLPNAIFWNNGFGEFNISTDFGNASDFTSELDIGDVDKDGDLDIVVVSSNIANKQNYLFYNNGNSQFNPSIVLGSSHVDSMAVKFGDVNGDGYLDIVIGNYFQQNVIHINDGNGNFVEERYFGPGNDDVTTIALGDVDNDGDLDIATGCNLTSLNAIYLNDGFGNFPTNGNPFGNNPSSFTASIIFADLNADNHLDLIVGNTDNDQSIAILNDGNGNFNTGFINISGSDTYQVNVGDVDGDGDIDIIAANEHSKQNIIELNDGNANFTTLNYGTGSDDSTAVDLGDLDGDGDLDLVVANRSETNVIYFNDTSLTATPIFVITPPSVGIDCSSVREYTVSISDASGVVGYRVAVNFDSSKVSYVPASADVLGTSAYPDFDSLTVNDTVPGQLIFTNASDDQPLGAGPATLLKFSLDFGSNIDEGEQYTISFTPLTQLNDGAIDSDTVDLVETVNPVNDAPSFSLSSVLVQRLEDAGAQSIIGFATNISPGGPEESGQTLTFHIETNNPSLFSASPVISSTGTLSFTSAPHANGSANLSIYLTDNGGVANCGIDSSTVQYANIFIQPVNDAPTFNVTGDQFVEEDAPAQTVIGFATNISAGPPNEATQTVQFIVSTDNNVLFSATPTISATGTLTYTPAPNANGSAFVTAVLKDNGGIANGGIDSSTQTFTIYVIAVNDEPTIGAVDDQYILEDSGVNIVDVTGISDGDPELDQLLTPSLQYTNPGLIASASFIVPASSATSTVLITPASDEFGSSIFTLTIQDDGSNAFPNDNIVSTSFIVNVSPVNDAPSFIVGASQNILNVSGGYQRTVINWATNIIAGPTNEVNQLLSFNVNAVPSGLFAVQPAVSATGVLTFTPAPNAHGIANVSLSISDNGGTLYGGINTSPTQAFTITSYNEFLWGDLNIDNVSGTVDASLLLRFDAEFLPFQTVYGTTFQEFPGYPIAQYPEYYQPRPGFLPFPTFFAFPQAATTQLEYFPPAADVTGDGIAGVLDAAKLLRVAALLDDYVPADTNLDGVGPDAPIFLTKQVSRSQLRPRTLLVDLKAEKSSTVPNAYTAWTMDFYVDNADDLSGFRIALTYDQSIVNVDEFSIEPLIDGAVIVVNNTQPGRLIVSGALLNIPGAGRENLLRVRMESASNSNQLFDTITVKVDEALTRLNDGGLSLSANSINIINLSETTNVGDWMLVE